MHANYILTLIGAQRTRSAKATGQIYRFLQRVFAILVLMLTSVSYAHADQLDDDLQTMWEATWDQRGTPRPISRWKNSELPIRYRVRGIETSSHIENIVQALEATSATTGLKFIDVSDKPNARELAQLDFEIVKEITSDPAFGCFVKPISYNGWYFSKVSLVLKSREVWGCIHHEMMHAMGIPGHPSGRTVLSYFKYRRDQLAPLDRVMLKAWYASEMAAGASPFKALPILAKYVAENTAAERDATAVKERTQQFLARTVLSMENFAKGAGEIPPIIRRSGFASENHIAEARKLMMTMLGVAYTMGDTVPKNPEQAMQWFTRAANAGHDIAQFALGIAYFKGEGFAQDKAKGYRWLTKAAAGQNTYLKDQLAEIEKSLSAAELEQLRQDAKE